MKKTIILFISALFLFGCASVDKTAFNKDKTYAVVVVGVNPEHRVFKYTGAKIGIVIDPDNLEEKNKDTKRYANKIATEFVRGLNKYAPVKIVSGNSVTGRSVYKKFKSIDKSRLSKRHEATHDYHMYWIDDYKRMPELAKKLGVDGVLMVYLEAGSHQSGAMGTFTPAVEVYLEGYSAEGKRVLRYNLRYISKDPEAQVKYRSDASHFTNLNKLIANKHGYLAGVDAAKRVWRGK